MQLRTTAENLFIRALMREFPGPDYVDALVEVSDEGTEELAERWKEGETIHILGKRLDSFEKMKEESSDWWF